MNIQNLTRAAAMVALCSAPATQAENLDIIMSQVFPQDHATYIGYESIEREDIPVSSAIERKYLVVDFRLASAQAASQQLQASVHKVCMALLKDRELIRSLSNSGYDMVSVAFDRRSQFDCL
ncbi:MAG: hypothetical protein ACTHWH_04290 [Marinobacter sp.]